MLSLLYNLIQNLEILWFDVSDYNYNCCHFQNSEYKGKLMYSVTHSGKNINKSQREEKVYDILGTPHQHLVGVSKSNKKWYLSKKTDQHITPYASKKTNIPLKNVWFEIRFGFGFY